MTQTMEPKPGQLLDISIETTLGAQYDFPDVDGREAMLLVQNFDGALSMSQLTLVNVTGSCLTLPTRVIHKIRAHRRSGRPPIFSWTRPA